MGWVPASKVGVATPGRMPNTVLSILTSLELHASATLSASDAQNKKTRDLYVCYFWCKIRANAPMLAL